MKPSILQGRDGCFYLVGETTVKLRAIALNPAFREAEKIDPTLIREYWIDKENLNQSYQFDTSPRPIGYAVRAIDKQTQIQYWWTGYGWREQRNAAKKYVRANKGPRAIKSAENYCASHGQDYMIDFEYVALYN